MPFPFAKICATHLNLDAFVVADGVDRIGWDEHWWTAKRLLSTVGHRQACIRRRACSSSSCFRLLLLLPAMILLRLVDRAALLASHLEVVDVSLALVDGSGDCTVRRNVDLRWNIGSARRSVIRLLHATEVLVEVDVLALSAVSFDFLEDGAVAIAAVVVDALTSEYTSSRSGSDGP